jgi:ABC transport system ATP-binding/permease protein
MWKLAIDDDEGKRTVVPLTRDQYTIGRKDGNTIRLTERNVSRDHARLFKKNGAGNGGADAKVTFVLEDLTSYNGVFVNGLRVTHAQDLVHGDLVQIGDYRILLQDEVVTDPAALGAESDGKKTIPHAPNSRAAALLDRPNRLVVLTGPVPGAEFPLERERLTIGRAEEADISVNHNSVSRIHCEVHALGEGRFEIVDKGSSNGVRVNGADLRRGIVEAGDVIELGDVKFKFVGAGQIFRPTDSQKLAALSDHEASAIVRPPRSFHALPVAIFAAVVVAGAVGAWVYTRPHGGAAAKASTAAGSPELTALEDAKKLCAAGSCDAAHQALQAALGPISPFRSTQDFKDIESRWADELIARADAETDSTKKRDLYQRVSQTIGVDAAHRKIAADKLQQMDAAEVTATPEQLLVASSKPRAEEATPPPPSRAEGSRKPAGASEPASPVAVAEPAPAPVTAQAAPKTASLTVDERERMLALQGTQDAKVALRQQLEPRVYAGKASDNEIRLLISTCKDLGDKTCVNAARAAQALKQQP